MQDLRLVPGNVSYETRLDNSPEHTEGLCHAHTGRGETVGRDTLVTFPVSENAS